jgi:transcriptional regulator with XRE-family HTH domain
MSGRADSELASKIKELRSGLGYSQRLLAEALHVSRPQVVEWENGASERPSTEKLIEILKWQRSVRLEHLGNGFGSGLDSIWRA